MPSLNPSISFRLPESERELIQRAARASRMASESEWYRAVLLAAAGETVLSEQLRRAAVAGRRAR